MSDWRKVEAKRRATVREEAKRLLARMDALEAAEKTEAGTHPRESGALKRASMDLTRALADLRRSPYVG